MRWDAGKIHKELTLRLGFCLHDPALSRLCSFRLDGSIDFTREVMQGGGEGGSANALAMAVAESASALHCIAMHQTGPN
jgi:hypothetical protein